MGDDLLAEYERTGVELCDGERGLSRDGDCEVALSEFSSGVLSTCCSSGLSFCSVSPHTLKYILTSLVTLKQEYNSTFIRTLRNAGGASAYVPTTSVYSGLDEIVEPQQGTGASAFILDERGAGVSNIDIQNTCTIAQAAGTVYTHEGMLYNPLTFALARDALQNGGPGQLGRINVTDECQKIVPDGLSVFDILATETLIPEAVLYIVTYANKTQTEPAIMPYAQKDVPPS
jgi:hypothetical protein